MVDSIRWWHFLTVASIRGGLFQWSLRFNGGFYRYGFHSMVLLSTMASIRWCRLFDRSFHSMLIFIDFCFHLMVTFTDAAFHSMVSFIYVVVDSMLCFIDDSVHSILAFIAGGFHSMVAFIDIASIRLWFYRWCLPFDDGVHSMVASIRWCHLLMVNSHQWSLLSIVAFIRWWLLFNGLIYRWWRPFDVDFYR